MMNILITGADGFIGKHLTRYLEERYVVFPIVIKRVAVKEVSFENQIILDLTDAKKAKSYFDEFNKKQKIDAIINLAFEAASPENIEDKGILYRNIEITKGVVDIAKILKPKKVINFSSAAVYSNSDGIYNELSQVRPSANNDCLYGLAKFCSETILDFMLENENLLMSHLRIAQVYGEGMREDRLIPVMLRELRQKNTITVYGNGERVANFIKVGKLLEFVDFFLTKDLSGIYNIGDENLSYFNLANRLIREHGNEKSRIIKEPRRSRAKFRLDTSKIDNLMREFQNAAR